MFAALTLNPVVGVGVAITLGVVGLLVLLTAGYGAVRLVKKRKGQTQTQGQPVAGSVLPGLLGAAKTAAASPLLAEVEKVIVAAIIKSQHAALNMAVGKAFPGLVPFLPQIDAAADVVENRVVKQLGTTDANSPMMPTLPTLPTLPTVVIPPGHPVLDLLQKTLAAKLDQSEQQQAKTA